jgi:hypothetical protein
MLTTSIISGHKTCADAYWHPARRSLARFASNPFESVTSFQQPKEVTKKGRTLLKFLTAQKDLVYGRQPRCRYKCSFPT